MSAFTIRSNCRELNFSRCFIWSCPVFSAPEPLFPPAACNCSKAGCWSARSGLLHQTETPPSDSVSPNRIGTTAPTLPERLGPSGLLWSAKSLRFFARLGLLSPIGVRSFLLPLVFIPTGIIMQPPYTVFIPPLPQAFPSGAPSADECAQSSGHCPAV